MLFRSRYSLGAHIRLAWTQRGSPTRHLRVQCVPSQPWPAHLDEGTPADELLADFEKPSAIQQRAILPITKGRDVIAQAQSGTGKTATFSISILQSIDTSLRETQALVLSPTRELATQIQSVVLALGGAFGLLRGGKEGADPPSCAQTT